MYGGIAQTRHAKNHSRGLGEAQLDVGRALLEAGLDARRANDEGSLPLHYAVMRGDAAMAALLLEADASPREDACPQVRYATRRAAAQRTTAPRITCRSTSRHVMRGTRPGPVRLCVGRRLAWCAGYCVCRGVVLVQWIWRSSMDEGSVHSVGPWVAWGDAARRWLL